MPPPQNDLCPSIFGKEWHSTGKVLLARGRLGLPAACCRAWRAGQAGPSQVASHHKTLRHTSLADPLGCSAPNCSTKLPRDLNSKGSAVATRRSLRGEEV